MPLYPFLQLMPTNSPSFLENKHTFTSHPTALPQGRLFVVMAMAMVIHPHPSAPVPQSHITCSRIHKNMHPPSQYFFSPLPNPQHPLIAIKSTPTRPHPNHVTPMTMPIHVKLSLKHSTPIPTRTIPPAPPLTTFHFPHGTAPHCDMGRGTYPTRGRLGHEVSPQADTETAIGARDMRQCTVQCRAISRGNTDNGMIVGSERANGNDDEEIRQKSQSPTSNNDIFPSSITTVFPHA
ncbi:hypothetical protein BCR34DRAFT_588054 [Clohesyomyces aquaticus]|uniref:Uncharacterized protein n=1 Tax=Clohesyomyces aquaticus TaxID=1231657 RepID=A0A1Y1ZN36_9PLEO|nr:hypothetical protein BCR34DRAFT_588054 [Clohesyomyces aquaticus]